MRRFKVIFAYYLTSMRLWIQFKGSVTFASWISNATSVAEEFRSYVDVAVHYSSGCSAYGCAFDFDYVVVSIDLSFNVDYAAWVAYSEDWPSSGADLVK